MEDINNMSNMKTDMRDFDRDKWNLKNPKIQVFSIVSAIFLAFFLGWVFLIPAIAVVLLAYGGIVYFKERKNRIMVSIKPTAAMGALARREAELKKEKERLTYESFAK
jgi:hypothetical protein